MWVGVAFIIHSMKLISDKTIIMQFFANYTLLENYMLYGKYQLTAAVFTLLKASSDMQKPAFNIRWKQ